MIRRRNSISACFTKPARAYRKIIAEAVKWYREAAERGYPAAQFNLGVFYETGQVVPQDYTEAANGIAPPPIRNAPPRSAISGFATKPGAAWSRTGGKR